MAVAGMKRTPIGEVYIAPNGVAFATWRIGELRNGVVVSRPELTPDGCERAGVEYVDRNAGV